MELEVKNVKSLEDGKHKGVIVRIEYRHDPFEYTDIFIKEAESGVELKYGVPTSVSEKSKLGRLMQQFVKLVPGDKLNPEQVLLSKRVTFMTMIETTENGDFSVIVKDSVKKDEAKEIDSPVSFSPV